jgi:hypothetical protein
MVKKKKNCVNQIGCNNANLSDINQNMNQNVNQSGVHQIAHEKGKSKNRRFMKRTRWKKVQDKKKSQEISAIYNYSKIVLTDDMNNILSKGLNFCVTPEQIILSELLVDFRKFERSVKWKEYFRDEENEEDRKPDIFPKEKKNLPPKHRKHLDNFLTGVKSKLRGTTLNKSTCNIPKGEVDASASLVNLQKECQIVIKPCDKDACILICDFSKYVEACNGHLTSETQDGHLTMKKSQKNIF